MNTEITCEACGYPLDYTNERGLLIVAPCPQCMKAKEIQMHQEAMTPWEWEEKDKCDSLTYKNL